MGGGATVVSTVVGSCVAVCLRDKSGIAGGMSHFILPYGSVRSTTRMRYANFAVPELVDLVRKAAGASDDLEAKLVGGASVVSAFSDSRRHLGEGNVEAARQYLEDVGVEVKVEVVGGRVGRKVIYEVNDGSMWVSELTMDRNDGE